MKKIIFILALFVSFVANAQYTPPTGYTNINSRYDWLAGVFRALGLPAGGNAAFTAGQAQRAGSVYYDSTGVDAGLYVWSGSAWVGVQYTDADARSAISLTTTGTSGAATYSSATGVFNIPNYQGGLSEIIAGYGLLNVNDSTLDVDSLVIANRDWVMDRIADIDTANLLVDSLGAAGISPITWWNNTIYGRRISISGGSIDTTASGGLLITVTGGSSYTFSTGLTEAAGTVTNNLSTGVSGGQSVIGGTASGNSLTYSSTSNATKGSHIWGTTAKMEFDETNSELRIGSATDLGAYNLQVVSASIFGRGAGNSVQRFTYSGTTGSAGLGFYGPTDVNQGLIRAFGSANTSTVGGIALANSTDVLALTGPLFLRAAGIVYTWTNTTAPAITALTSGRVGLNGIVAPTGWLHLPAGTTAASTAPLKFTTGTSLTTAEAGAIEYTTDDLFFTISTGTARKRFLLADPVGGLTSGRIPFVTTNGRLTDVSTVLWDGTTATFPLLKITGGSPGAGKVLTSDADGDATWTTATKPTLTKNAMVENPTAAENLFMFRTPVAITVTDVTAVLVGGTPSITYNIAFGTDRTSATNVYTAGQTVTSETTGTAASGVNDATIPAGSWIWITTSAATDVTQLNISLTYTED